MSPLLTGIAGFVIMLALIFVGMPVGLSMTLVGVVGFGLIVGFSPSLMLAGLSIPSTLQDYSFAVIPLFLLMGEFAAASGMMRDVYRAANTWLGNVRGGLAMASILGAAAFSAVSGSSLACAVLMARVALPSLLEHRYSPALAVGTLASGGTLGNLVPPGVLLIVYALLSRVSVGELMIAAVIPGALLTVMYLAQIYIQCRIDPAAGPRAGVTTAREKLWAIVLALPLVATFALVTGGIWYGVFTAFEAAAVGTLVVFLYAAIRRTLSWRTVHRAFLDTVVTTGMIFSVIIGSHFFTSFLAVSGLTRALTAWIVGMQLSPFMVVFAIMMVYFVIGTAMDTLAMLLLTLPIFIAIVQPMGVDLVWFGILVIVQMELSNITPPVGLYIYGVAGMVKDRGISMATVFRGVLPFCATCLIFSLILLVFPDITLFLVRLMRG